MYSTVWKIACQNILCTESRPCRATARQSQGQYDCRERSMGKLGTAAMLHVPQLQRALQIFASDILQEFRPGVKVPAAY